MQMNLTIFLLAFSLLPLSMLVFPRQLGALMQAWTGASANPRPIFVRLSAITMLIIVALIASDSGIYR